MIAKVLLNLKKFNVCFFLICDENEVFKSHFAGVPCLLFKQL